MVPWPSAALEHVRRRKLWHHQYEAQPHHREIFLNEEGRFDGINNNPGDSSLTVSTMMKVRAQIGASTSPSTLVLGPSSSTPSPPARSVHPSIRRSASLPPIVSLREPTQTPSCPPTVEKPSRKYAQRVICGDGESCMLRRSKRNAVTSK